MKSNAWKIYMLAIVSFLVGTSEFMIAGILDKIAEDVGVSVGAAGQLITLFSLAYAFGTPVVLALTARMERRSLLLYALGLFVLGNVLVVAVPGFEALIVSRIVLALSTGAFIVTSLTVASKMAAPGKQGSAIATLVMGFSTSLIIGVPLGRVIAASYDWTLTFGAIGALALLAMALVYFVIPKAEGEAPVPLRKQLALIRQPKIAIALMISFFWIGGYSIAYTYISPFLLDIAGMSEKGVSAGLLAFGVASLIGSKLGGYTTDRWGAGITLVSGMVLHAAALLLLSIGALPVPVVFGLLMFWAFSAWSSGPTQQYNLISLAPEASGIMLSLNMSVIQLAMAAGAGIGGIVTEQVSLSSITWIGAAGVAIAALTAAASFGFLGAGSRAKTKKAELGEAGV